VHLADMQVAAGDGLKRAPHDALNRPGFVGGGGY
jgi:hypothetical protein